jgi:hypothetical protein
MAGFDLSSEIAKRMGGNKPPKHSELVSQLASGMAGMTLNQAVQPLLAQVPKKGGLSDVAIQELADAIRLLVKGVPRSVLKEVDQINFLSKLTPGYGKEVATSKPFGEHGGIAGWISHFLNQPKTPAEISVVPVRETRDFPNTLSEFFGHEFGHHGNVKIARDNFSDTVGKYSTLPLKTKEGLADYLRDDMLRRAGLPPGPNTSQQLRGTPVYETLSQSPGNAWDNVHNFLKSFESNIDPTRGRIK